MGRLGDGPSSFFYLGHERHACIYGESAIFSLFWILFNVLLFGCLLQSPNGYTVASAAADETLRFWNVFGTPELAKPEPKSNPEPFANLARIR